MRVATYGILVYNSPTAILLNYSYRITILCASWLGVASTSSREGIHARSLARPRTQSHSRKGNGAQTLARAGDQSNSLSRIGIHNQQCWMGNDMGTGDGWHAGFGAAVFHARVLVVTPFPLCVLSEERCHSGVLCYTSRSPGIIGSRDVPFYLGAPSYIPSHVPSHIPSVSNFVQLELTPDKLGRQHLSQCDNLLDRITSTMLDDDPATLSNDWEVVFGPSLVHRHVWEYRACSDVDDCAEKVQDVSVFKLTSYRCHCCLVLLSE
jgi:hypothetical protein